MSLKHRRSLAMSYCKREGKDKSVFVTAADVQEPALVKELVEEEHYGIILPDGQINWDCPCLGGMAYGSCGTEFKDAFSCFHYSEEEEKGVDCIPQFRAMQECFKKYPEEYSKFNDDEEEGGEGQQEEGAQGEEQDISTGEPESSQFTTSEPESKTAATNSLSEAPGSSTEDVGKVSYLNRNF